MLKCRNITYCHAAAQYKVVHMHVRIRDHAGEDGECEQRQIGLMRRGKK